MLSIPYPPRFDQNVDEALIAERYDAVVQQLDAGDVIAEVEDAVARIADPKAHPLYGVVGYYLDAGGPETGRLPWNLEAMAAAYDRLVKEALSRVIDARLAQEGD